MLFGGSWHGKVWEPLAYSIPKGRGVAPPFGSTKPIFAGWPKTHPYQCTSTGKSPQTFIWQWWVELFCQEWLSGFSPFIFYNDQSLFVCSPERPAEVDPLGPTTCSKPGMHQHCHMSCLMLKYDLHCSQQLLLFECRINLELMLKAYLHPPLLSSCMPTCRHNTSQPLTTSYFLSNS